MYEQLIGKLRNTLKWQLEDEIKNLAMSSREAVS